MVSSDCSVTGVPEAVVVLAPVVVVALADALLAPAALRSLTSVSKAFCRSVGALPLLTCVISAARPDEKCPRWPWNCQGDALGGVTVMVGGVAVVVVVVVVSAMVAGVVVVAAGVVVVVGVVAVVVVGVVVVVDDAVVVAGVVAVLAGVVTATGVPPVPVFSSRTAVNSACTKSRKAVSRLVAASVLSELLLVELVELAAPLLLDELDAGVRPSDWNACSKACSR